MDQAVSLKTKEIPISLDSLLARHFSVEEYHRMVEVGILREDERIELIDGRILKMIKIYRKDGSVVVGIFHHMPTIMNQISHSLHQRKIESLTVSNRYR